jgi:hypothetical protein
MNPIEKAFSKLKAYLRKTAERTVAGLMWALEACAFSNLPTHKLLPPPVAMIRLNRRLL